MLRDLLELSQGATRDSIEHHAAILRDDPLYLDRCQVDTPPDLVGLVWEQILRRRSSVQRVVDFGAGDARFAAQGEYDTYLGYEIDIARFATSTSSKRVSILPRCAFSHKAQDADICVGNPPYVRNQDLPSGWRQMAAKEVLDRTGVSLSGLANAWQYFLMLALWSVKPDGLVAQVLPFEWVSRPAAEPIRRYIDQNGWSVAAYRLRDGIFTDVQTAASISIIDKRGPEGWQYFDLERDGATRVFGSPSGAPGGVIPYTAVRDMGAPRAKRGLSPGTQDVLTLTEGQRVHAGLKIGRDVVRCVTSLRPIPAGLGQLTLEEFNAHYASAGEKCWLIRTDREPSLALRGYLASIEEARYQTATCLARQEWWNFPMPVEVPEVLIAQAFKGASPKAVVNEIRAYPVGGVAGVYHVNQIRAQKIVESLARLDLRDRLVPYSKQMCKLEINQINSLLIEFAGDEPA